MAKKLGRSEGARQAHFRKAGPTEKTGHEKIKETRQADKLEEQEALREERIPEPDEESAIEDEPPGG